MPAAMLRLFQQLHSERALKHLVAGISLHKVQEFYPQPDDPDYLPKNDAPWIRRYAAAGGRVIVSGNTKMKVVAHERLALVQEGMTVIFFPGVWSNWKFCRKSSLLLHWWPVILKAARKPKPGFFVVPRAWPDEGKAKLREVPTDDLKLVKIEQQLAARDGVRKAREKRRADSTQTEMKFDGQAQES